MTDHSDFLTNTEKQHLAVGLDGVRRAQVLANVAELSYVLGGEARAAEVIDSVREQLESLDAKQLKKIGRHVVSTLSLVRNVPTSVNTQEMPRTLELTTEPEATTELLVESSQDEEGLSISSSGLRFLKKGLGDTWWQELGFSSAQDATPSAVAEVMARGAKVNRPATVEEVQSQLERYLSGVSMVALAEERGVEQSGISAKLRRIRDDRRWQHVSNGAEDLTTPGMREGIHAQELEPMSHDEIMSAWSDALQLNAQERAAFEAHLNYEGSARVTGEQAAVIQKFVAHITERFSTIDDPSLVLGGRQKMLLRQLTGAWYQQLAHRPVVTTQTTFATIYKKADPRAKATDPVLLDEALQKLLPAAAAEQISVVDAHEAEVKTDSDKPLDLFAVPDAEWPRVAEQTYLESASKLFSDDETLELWTRLRFDDQGAYRATLTDVQRGALKKLQQRFFEVGSVRLIDKRLQQTALRVLCNMSQGVNSLDDVYMMLQKQDPVLAKHATERYVLDGIVELLR